MTEIDNTAGTSRPAPPKNALFGKYELGRLLGCGAFAKVYYARDVRSGQSLAIKVFSKQKLNVHANLKSNMMREVAIMRRLRHPNIVRLFEVLASRTKIYFVLEFVKGGELFDKIVKGRFTEDLSRKYFQQLISAVSYCHSRGVFHRDLKPENLLIDENGDLKVSDFGLSALTDHVRQDGLLHTLCGTPAYVAPEVLAKKGYDGAKADVWSAGVILYVLAAGYLPFNDPNLMGMYKKIYSGEFKCPKWMSPELKQILARLLDTNPETRISMDEIKSDPWFRKDYKEVNSYDDEYEFCFDNSKEEDNTMPLTAFDIISFSSGLNLSGLFEDSRSGTENRELLTVESSPERIVPKIEEIAKEQNMGAKKKKELGVEIKGQNGNFVLSVFVYRLTDRLAVVEAKQRGGDDGLYNELWDTKIRPVILGRREEQILGNQNSPATVGND